MEKINIICVDDQPEVLDSVLRDLRPLSSYFRIEGVESAAECRELLEEFDAEGEYVGLVISDHVMPGGNGVELLRGIAQDGRFAKTRKILLTGQATHADTIQAVNEAHIDNYLEKPWDATALVATAKKLLTAFILDKGIEHLPFMPILDQSVLLSRLHRG
ncbi:MAG: response regulator [Akkermansia sp.]|nr:response regulator [Akkermansia sp.]